MTVNKIDPKIIFASNAPAIDKPPVFGDKTKGWDVSRLNNGRPKILQMNKIQQDTDLKILWLNENATAPYDETIDYADGVVVLKDGEFQKKTSEGWISFNKPKPYILEYYKTGEAYPLNARIMLANGDIVQSTIANNTNNPNSNPTGWKFGSEGFVIDLSKVADLSPSNITSLIQSALNKSVTSPVTVIFPNSEIILSSKITAPIGSKGLILDLNGSTVKAPSVANNADVEYLFDIMCPNSNLVVIKNGIIDGSLRDQNLFEATNPNDLKKGCSGISAQSQNIVLSNLTIQHMYGQTTRTIFRNLQVENVFINDCGGHWYQNDGYDAFGDAFYIGTGWNDTGVITANFINTVVVAKHSDQYPENHQPGSPLTQIQYSRIGVTLEKFFGENSNTVYINLYNCDFRYLERGFHQEAKGINSFINLSNTRYDSCVLFGAYLTDVMQSNSDFCNFNFYESNYNGSKGIVRSYAGLSIANMNNCTSNHIGSSNTNLFGLGGTINAKNCKFENVQGLWADTVTLSFERCTVNVASLPSLSYYAWASSIDLYKTKVNYSGAYVSKPDQTGSYKRIVDCEFENVLFPIENTFYSSNFDRNKYISSNTSGVNFESTVFSSYDVYDSLGKLIKAKGGLWGVSYPTYSNSRIYYKYHPRVNPTTPIDIVDSDLQALMSNNGLGLLVAKGSQTTSVDEICNISPTAYASGYYVGIVKFNPDNPKKVQLVGSMLSVGSTSGAGMDLTFDADLNVTPSGTYSTYVHCAVVPFRERDTLPFVPDPLI